MLCHDSPVSADFPAATAARNPLMAQPTPPVDGLPVGRFLDREVSWLAFNQRVLELAEDVDLPLLDRVKFIAIFASNLDEFFMVRVAGLKRRLATGIAVRAASGLMPREVLEQIWAQAYALQQRQADLFRGTLMPALDANGIRLLRWEQLGQAQRVRRERQVEIAVEIRELEQAESVEGARQSGQNPLLAYHTHV